MSLEIPEQEITSVSGVGQDLDYGGESEIKNHEESELTACLSCLSQSAFSISKELVHSIDVGCLPCHLFEVVVSHETKNWIRRKFLRTE